MVNVLREGVGWWLLCRVREEKNCPLRFSLGLNLSTRVGKSNLDYFATKQRVLYNSYYYFLGTENIITLLSSNKLLSDKRRQLSMVWTIVHGMENCPHHGHLSIPWTIFHATDICPYHGQVSMVRYGQLSMTWTIAIQLSILWEMSIVKTIVHSMDRLLLSTDYMSICLAHCFGPKLSTRFRLSTKILSSLSNFLGPCFCVVKYQSTVW